MKEIKSLRASCSLTEKKKKKDHWFYLDSPRQSSYLKYNIFLLCHWELDANIYKSSFEEVITQLF